MRRLVDVARQLPGLLERGDFASACQLIRQEVPIDHLAVARVAAGGDHMRLYVLWLSDDVAVPAVQWAQRMPVTRNQLEMIYASEPYRVCDDTLASPQPIERLFGQAGIGCTLSIPVGRPIDAVIGFGFRDRTRVRAEHVPLLRELSHLLHDELDFTLLEAHAHRLRVMVESLPMGALLINREGNVVEANAAAARLAGLPTAVLLGRSLRELITASDGGLLGWRIDQANGPTPALLHGTGAPRPVEVQLAAPTPAHGGYFGPLFVFDGNQAAAQLAALEAKHRELLDNLPVLVFSHDDQVRCTYVNGAVERILGYTTAEIYAMKSWAQLNVDAPLPDAKIPAGNVETDFRQRRKDGREIIMRYHVYRTVGENGRVVRTDGYGIDVTNEREAQRRLLLADRLAALGMLVAGIGHEINNPAAYVMLGVQQMLRHLQRARAQPTGVLPLIEALTPILDDVMIGIQRIATIVGELKLFARNPATDKGPLDLNVLLRSAASLVQGELRNRARLTLDLGDLPTVPGEWARLSQVIINLLVNAAQAIPPGNALEHEVLVQSRLDDDEVRIVVRDSGRGMDQATQQRIFTPFFTTKPAGEGSGLGLAISYDLASRLGGRITVASEVDRGSTFTVSVPYVAPSAAGRGLGEEEPVGSVLIIDDERALASAIARELSRRMRVQQVYSGAEALALLETTRFDAVLCDVRMQDLSGIDVYAQTHARDPAQAERFIFMTGAGAAAGEAEFLRAAGRPVLEKPFDMADLWRSVGAIVKSRA